MSVHPGAWEQFVSENLVMEGAIEKRCRIEYPSGGKWEEVP